MYEQCFMQFKKLQPQTILFLYIQSTDTPSQLIVVISFIPLIMEYLYNKF